MNEQEVKDNFTQLWQRLVALENKHIDTHLRLQTLEAARNKQIEINTQLLNWKANPDKNEPPSSWWKKLW